MTNLEIIKSIYTGSPEERAQNALKHIRPNVKWQESEGYLYGGLYNGLQEVQSIFIKQATEWIGFKNEADQFFVDDAQNSVVVVGFYSGTNVKTQKPFKARFAHLWKLENQKVTEFTQYIDSHKVWEATQEKQ